MNRAIKTLVLGLSLTGLVAGAPLAVSADDKTIVIRKPMKKAVQVVEVRQVLPARGELATSRG